MNWRFSDRLPSAPLAIQRGMSIPFSPLAEARMLTAFAVLRPQPAECQCDPRHRGEEGHNTRATRDRMGREPWHTRSAPPRHVVRAILR